MAKKPRARSCRVGEVFGLLGRAHMLDVLAGFLRGEPGEARRFVEIQKELKLSPNTLSDRLSELVEAGLLERTAFNEIPPRVDYVATDKARALGPIFETIDDWSSRHDLSPEPASPAKARS